jgi:glycosyltransferase
VPTKISIVTATYNRVHSLRQAVQSVQDQTHAPVEHVVVDGGSTDGSQAMLSRLLRPGDVMVSEPDHGIYDALNKGLRLASGEVVGFMHSDDFFADCGVLADVARAFDDPQVDAAYGDLDYVSKNETDRIVRRWRSTGFDAERLRRGWMPPHPTLYLRRRVIEQWGGFDTGFRISADYDAVLRYFGPGAVRSVYLPRVLVKMRTGGESNRSLERVLVKMREDYRALKKNQVGGLGALAWKNLSKLGQFF